MLKKKKRIDKVLFQEVMNSGRTISSPFFLFKYVPKKEPQYAFVAPKSVAKLATSRNKLRRQGYSVLNRFHLPNYAGIFFYKKTSKTLKSVDIKEDILNILSKLKN